MNPIGKIRAGYLQQVLPQVTTDRLAEFTRLVNRGALKVHVERTFPLEGVAAALVALEKESPRGKVVVEVA